MKRLTIIISHTHSPHRTTDNHPSRTTQIPEALNGRRGWLTQATTVTHSISCHPWWCNIGIPYSQNLIPPQNTSQWTPTLPITHRNRRNAPWPQVTAWGGHQEGQVSAQGLRSWWEVQASRYHQPESSSLPSHYALSRKLPEITKCLVLIYNRDTLLMHTKDPWFLQKPSTITCTISCLKVGLGDFQLPRYSMKWEHNNLQ